MTPEQKHLICTKPFEWFEATERWNGYPVFLCCCGWLPKPAGDLAKQTPQEIWHSDEAKEIRKSVVDGSFKYCKPEFCPHLNAVSGPVKYVSERVRAYYEKTIDENNFHPKHLNCSYDKSCNLSCPSCRIELIMAKGLEKDTIARLGDSLFEAFGATLDTVYMTGSGDPFASKHFLSVLTGDLLKKHKQLRLHLHTNAQLFTPAIWERIKLSKGVIDILEVSIDGASRSTYEDNRRPGKWAVLLGNMNFIARLKQSGHIHFLKVSFVVQQNNYHEMNDFVILGKRWNADTIYFAPLDNWNTHSNTDYMKRAVHKKTHAEHNLLVEEIKKMDLDDTQVELGYLRNLALPEAKPLAWTTRVKAWLRSGG